MVRVVIEATMQAVVSAVKMSTRANGRGDVGASRKTDTLGKSSQLWQARAFDVITLTAAPFEDVALENPAQRLQQCCRGKFTCCTYGVTFWVPSCVVGQKHFAVYR